jgi:hypothetical protein
MNLLLKNLLLNNFINKKNLFIIGFSCLYSSSFAQINYIPNPSFEYINTCVFFEGNIRPAFPWDTLIAGGGGFPSVFHSCNTLIGNRTPHTNDGYKIPRTGVGIGSIGGIYISTSIGRFYAQTPLKQILINTKSYTVTFYVSRSACAQYCVDRIGAYLDNGSVNASCWSCLVNGGVIPQVENPQHNIITDTVNWTKIQGCFKASGTESYLTLGNFYPDSLVDTASAPYNPNYGVVNNSSYFIDDVSVIESNSIIKADNDTIINKGDTITLGKSIEGMPVDWYDLQGNLLAASSTLKVHPITTTSYVVKMDLCGNVSYDTVTVNVSTGVEKLEFESGQLVVYPNPASNELICKCANMLINTIEVSDVLGRLYAIPPFERGLGGLELNILTLPNGIYFIKASDVKGNVMNGKFVKE